MKITERDIEIMGYNKLALEWYNDQNSDLQYLVYNLNDKEFKFLDDYDNDMDYVYIIRDKYIDLRKAIIQGKKVLHRAHSDDKWKTLLNENPNTTFNCPIEEYNVKKSNTIKYNSEQYFEHREFIDWFNKHPNDDIICYNPIIDTFFETSDIDFTCSHEDHLIYLINDKYINVRKALVQGNKIYFKNSQRYDTNYKCTDIIQIDYVSTSISLNDYVITSELNVKRI